MPYQVQSDWLRHCGGAFGDSPTFTVYARNAETPSTSAASLRSAFAFFRRHGDRRYSPQTLMKLLHYADRLDAGSVDENVGVCIAEMPYSYDEETEVKSGGIVAAAVFLPDDRLMLCVHQEKRLQSVGRAMLQLVIQYVHPNPVVWVHRHNTGGARFCLATDLLPWEINQNGAVQYASERPAGEDTGAVARADDEMIDALLRRQQRGLRPARPTTFVGDYLAQALESEEEENDGYPPEA